MSGFYVSARRCCLVDGPGLYQICGFSFGVDPLLLYFSIARVVCLLSMWIAVKVFQLGVELPLILV